MRVKQAHNLCPAMWRAVGWGFGESPSPPAHPSSRGLICAVVNTLMLVLTLQPLPLIAPGVFPHLKGVSGLSLEYMKLRGPGSLLCALRGGSGSHGGFYIL